MSLQPLLAADHRTPVGAATDGGPYAVDTDGSFTAALPVEQVQPTGDPIAPLLLQAQLTLTGRLCGQATFICGDVTGSVTKPITIADLTGSTFTMQKITDPANYPTPLLDCKKTEVPPAP
jgi:hypothetical protein